MTPSSSPPPQPAATSESAVTSNPRATRTLRFLQSTSASSPWDDPIAPSDRRARKYPCSFPRAQAAPDVVQRPPERELCRRSGSNHTPLGHGISSTARLRVGETTFLPRAPFPAAAVTSTGLGLPAGRAGLRPRSVPTRRAGGRPDRRRGCLRVAGAGGGDRTHTPRGARDFESRASASSATPARRIVASARRGHRRPEAGFAGREARCGPLARRGEGGGTRGTWVPPRNRASASSATPARRIVASARRGHRRPEAGFAGREARCGPLARRGEGGGTRGTWVPPRIRSRPCCSECSPAAGTCQG